MEDFQSDVQESERAASVRFPLLGLAVFLLLSIKFTRALISSSFPLCSANGSSSCVTPATSAAPGAKKRTTMRVCCLFFLTLSFTPLCSLCGSGISRKERRRRRKFSVYPSARFLFAHLFSVRETTEPCPHFSLMTARSLLEAAKDRGRGTPAPQAGEGLCGLGSPGGGQLVHGDPGRGGALFMFSFLCAASRSPSHTHGGSPSPPSLLAEPGDGIHGHRQVRSCS